ncbi:hypothetical protein HDU86_006888 [Geranomyces michiganensis]|nr:hypothetical protein HDU86_006888 [Geranomyces michiganensis]
MHCNHFNAPKSYDRHSFDTRRASQLTERSDTTTGEPHSPWRAEDLPQPSSSANVETPLMRRSLQFSNSNDSLSPDAQLPLQPATEAEKPGSPPLILTQSSASDLVAEAVKEMESRTPELVAEPAAPSI